MEDLFVALKRLSQLDQPKVDLFWEKNELQLSVDKGQKLTPKKWGFVCTPRLNVTIY